MTLETYISDLLYRYDCVIIPDFGAFLSKRISAQINQDDHSFLAPRKELSFNPQLKHNDGLLCNYIAEIQKIPYADALSFISSETGKYQEALNNNEVLNFRNVGAICKTETGLLRFDPSKETNFLTSSFGLSNFTASSIQRLEHKDVVKHLEDKAPIIVSHEKKTSISWVKYAAAAVLVLGLGGYAGLRWHKAQVNSFNEMAHEQASKKVDQKVQEATFVISNPLPSIVLNVEKQSGNFHVVAGAFRIEENSIKKVQQLKSLGYKARVIGINRYGLHEVVYSSYKTRLEAQEALKTIRANHNPEAWLLIKNLDK